MITLFIYDLWLGRSKLTYHTLSQANTAPWFDVPRVYCPQTTYPTTHLHYLCLMQGAVNRRLTDFLGVKVTGLDCGK